MKQIEVQVRTRALDDVLSLAERHDAFEPSHHPIRVDGEEGWHRVLVNVPNSQVGPLVDAVESAVDEAEFVIPASGNLPVRTPLKDVRDRVEDVSSRSTLELVLDVLQSVGSWKGMLLYSVVSGLVAAYGVIFNLSFLLTAAMLIAPLGAPVMVCVVGVALGDLWMLRRGALRFAVSLLVLAGAAAVLGLLYGLRSSTAMMETLTNLSGWSAMLGVVGGAAGAQALIQADRDSLVTATATGFLVAVSLSPPSAVLGLAAALGRWDYVGLMAFVIALTAVGIVFGGWASLRFRGVKPARASAGRGHSRMATAMVLASLVLLLGLVGWQRTRGPSFHKADRARQATELARAAVDSVPGYRTVDVEAEFTTGDAAWHPGEGLLLRVVVARGPEDARPMPEGVYAEGRLQAAITREIEGAMSGVRPFVALTILP